MNDLNLRFDECFAGYTIGRVCDSLNVQGVHFIAGNHHFSSGAVNGRRCSEKQYTAGQKKNHCCWIQPQIWPDKCREISKQCLENIVLIFDGGHLLLNLLWLLF